MLNVTGQSSVREVVIRGTDAELEALAEALNDHMVWEEAEESSDLIPKEFFSKFYNALNVEEE